MASPPGAGLALPGREAARTRWRSWALWASLALNVFLLPLLGMQYAQHRPPRPGPGTMADRLTRGMPPEDAARFRTALDGERQLFAMAQERVDDARASLTGALARTPYDDGLVRQRMAEFQQRLREQFERISDAMLPTVATLSPEARQRLAATIEHAPPPRPRDRRADPGSPP